MILNSLKFSIKIIHNFMAKYVREREEKGLESFQKLLLFTKIRFQTINYNLRTIKTC